MLSKNFKILTEAVPDISEFINNDMIKVIRLHLNDKKPKDTDYYNLDIPLDDLKKHRGNFGVCVGYNHDKNNMSLACIDIDGYKLKEDIGEDKDFVKQFTKNHIYKCLKEELGNSLQVSTQSDGYHLYLWNESINDSIHETSKSLYFPADFQIEELRGKCLDSSIEIFTKFGSKQVVLPSSKTRLKENKFKTKSYDVIGEINELIDIRHVKDINQSVIESLTKHGYIYKPKTETRRPKQSNNTFRAKNTRNNNNNLKTLTESEINKVVKLVAPLFGTINDEKHIGALAIGGYFSNNIDLSSAEKIADGIINQIGNIFKSTTDFKKTILQHYTDRQDIKNKTGLPSFCELVVSKDDEFNATEFMDKIQFICNKSFIKTKIGEFKSNDDEDNGIPIVLYETYYDKYLKYEGYFDGIDLVLNFGSNIATFINSRTDKTIHSFRFKFKDRYFEVQKSIMDSTIVMMRSKIGCSLGEFFADYLRASIDNLDDYATAPKKLSIESELKLLFKERNRESYARKELGNYLYENGVILRKYINQAYMYNPETNGFDSKETDDLLIWLNNIGDFDGNSISNDDVNQALKFIGDRRQPKYNIVKFKNCIYDLEQFKVIKNTEEPVLTLTEVSNYNYNPNAEGNKIIHFLETSLHQRGDTEEQLNERVKAFYEFIGYILTSGNKLNSWFIFAGIGGAGKGVATNIITTIFGSANVGHLQIQELTTENRFATSNLVNKQINIVTDSPTKPIQETGLLKAITGYDDIPVEFKGQDKTVLPKEEVPDFLTVCNNFPRFAKGFDMQVIQRIIIFEFLNQFRGTKKQNTHLLDEILSNPEEIEFLLYKGIMAYKEMIQNNNDFRARLDENKTIELLGKHTNPIENYILPKLVKVNFYAKRNKEEPIIPKQLNQLILYVAKQHGLSITEIQERNYQIKPQILLEKIRACFDFDETYSTTTTNDENNKTIRVYPNLSKTPEYNEYLKEMENDKEWKEMIQKMNGK